MKIAITATGKNKDDILDRRFGRCEYFQILNLEAGEIIVINNKGVSSGGGAGIAAASQLIDENVNIIVTGNLGPNAYELLDKAGIKAYSCKSVSVSMAIEMFQNNQLSHINTSVKAHSGMN